MRLLLACGLNSKITNRPLITKPIHWSLQDGATILSTFDSCDLIFKVTKGQNEVNFGLQTKVQENQ